MPRKSRTTRWLGLGKRRTVSTQTLPIGGGRDFPRDAAARERWLADAAAATGLSRERLQTLLDRYGATALTVAGHIAGYASERPLAHARGYSHAEIDYIARFEKVVSVRDIVLRRTTMAITGALARRDIDEIAEIAGAALVWSENRRSEEVVATVEELTTKHGYRWPE